ncbi:MAG: ribosomal-processing cysteine protease Prp [Ruminococcaceae bacterium]|nr:ribosomal-processing cysteine protease Prp [Oscillospiraceae bacterium]
MTRITFFRSDGIFYGFEEKGHTGYGEEGGDVLCAAISAMSMFLINTVEVAYASRIEYEIDDNTTTVRVKCKSALPEFEEDDFKRYAVSGIFLGYYQQLTDMLEEYGDYLDVKVINREYED